MVEPIIFTIIIIIILLSWFHLHHQAIINVFKIRNEYLEVIERNKELRIAVFIAGRGEKVFPGGPSGHHHGHRDEEEDEEEDGHEHDGADKPDNEYDGRLKDEDADFF